MIRTLALVATLAATPALAQSAHADLTAIDSAIAQFTGLPQGAPGGAAMPVDRRLRLNPCRVPLALGWYGARRDTVEVSCPVAGGWRLYVPLAVTTQAAASSPTVIKGDSVTITVASEGFAVSQPGEALESGPQGAWIKVRGLGPAAPVLRARVIRPGLVGIDLP
jgi:flagellar basal body P-ring formation protein FlgA